MASYSGNSSSGGKASLHLVGLYLTSSWLASTAPFLSGRPVQHLFFLAGQYSTFSFWPASTAPFLSGRPVQHLFFLASQHGPSPSWPAKTASLLLASQHRTFSLIARQYRSFCSATSAPLLLARYHTFSLWSTSTSTSSSSSWPASTALLYQRYSTSFLWPASTAPLSQPVRQFFPSSNGTSALSVRTAPVFCLAV